MSKKLKSRNDKPTLSLLVASICMEKNNAVRKFGKISTKLFFLDNNIEEKLKIINHSNLMKIIFYHMIIIHSITKARSFELDKLRTIFR